MINLITSPDGFQIDADPMLYALAAFAELLEDRKADKNLLMKELAYMYFFSNPKSDFQFQVDEVERNRDVIKYVNLPTGWVKDELFENAHDVYIYGCTTSASKLLEGARIGSDKLDKKLRSIDLDKVDKNGKEVYNLKQIQDTINNMPKTMESLLQAEKIYIKAQEESDKIRDGKMKSLYD